MARRCPLWEPEEVVFGHVFEHLGRYDTSALRNVFHRWVQDTLSMELEGLRTPCVEHIPFDPSISEHSNSTNNAGVMPALPSPHQCALILPVY